MYIKKTCCLMAFALIILACNKGDDSSDDQGGIDRGSLTFYKHIAFPCNSINITVTDSDGNDSSGTLSGAAVVTGTPNCDVPNTFTFLNLEYGTYDFVYTCAGVPVMGGISINSDCRTIMMIN